MEIAMGGRNRCIGATSVSFPIHLNMRWCCTAAKNHAGYVCGCLRVLVPLGGVPLSLTGLRVLTDPNTLFWVAVAHFHWEKWFMHHEPLAAKQNGLLVNLNWDTARVCCILLWSSFYWMEQNQKWFIWFYFDALQRWIRCRFRISLHTVEHYACAKASKCW